DFFGIGVDPCYGPFQPLRQESYAVCNTADLIVPAGRNRHGKVSTCNAGYGLIQPFHRYPNVATEQTDEDERHHQQHQSLITEDEKATPLHAVVNRLRRVDKLDLADVVADKGERLRQSVQGSGAPFYRLLRDNGAGNVLDPDRLDVQVIQGIRDE